MDATILDRIGQWIARADFLSNKDLHDEFLCFFIYYMCLDAWMTSEAGVDSDMDKLSWLTNHGGILKRVFDNKEFDLSSLTLLQGLSPIKDLRPLRGGGLTYLHDTTNFKEVVGFIYQIRCNLFHGGKNPIDSRDNNLVFSAEEFLAKWIRWAYIQANGQLLDYEE